MAKINGFLASYSDNIKELGITYDENTKPPKSVINRFVRLFKDVEDERYQGMIDYPLIEIILIAFLAVLGNASTWSEIEMFGKAKERWLKKFIHLKNGTPSHDTFRRVFSLIDTQQLQEATVAFLIENIQAIKKSLPQNKDTYRLICVDGKEQRGTGRKGSYSGDIRNLQTLHIYDASNEICIYSEAIDTKTNEIPVAQKALEKMQLKGCIVTFDALHMQKDTVAIIRNEKGDYVGGLKGNQVGLMEEAADYFRDSELLAFYKEKGDYYQTLEKAHGQSETREYYLVRPSKRAIVKEWSGLKAFICCKKTMTNIHTGEKKSETRYYAASIDDVELCAQAIRGHWGVENNLHWHLDYTMREDENTTMDRNAFNNLSLLNKMALSLFKLVKPLVKTPSMRVLRKQFGWDIEGYLSILLNCFDNSTIAEAMLSTKK